MMTTTLFLVLSASASPLCASASEPGADDPLTELELHEIELGGEVIGAEVGRLRVPENRSDPESRTIELAFVRLLSTSEEPGAPLVYLPGGPGNSATPMAGSPAWLPFLELGDVVLMDPRGVGDSEPDLLFESSAIRSELFFADRETAVRHMADMCAEAAASLAERGIDLRGYHTVELADDIVALADALDYDALHLMGHSYGTHLGLAILARHPERVARFISVGTAGLDEMMKLPADVDASLRLLSDVVAADATVGEAMPDLYAAFERVVADLGEDPLPVTIRDPRSGEPTEVLLGDFGARLIVIADIADTNDVPVFPRLIHSLENRDPSVVAWFLEKRVAQFARLPLMMLAVRGASGASEARWRTIREQGRRSPFGTSRCLFSPEADEALELVDLGDAFRAPIESDVPTLFVSGGLDAATPPAQAERVRRGFETSGHIVVEFAGHEDLLPDPRVQELLVAFLAGDAPEDTTLSGTPPRFVPLEGDVSVFGHPALARR